MVHKTTTVTWSVHYQSDNPGTPHLDPSIQQDFMQILGPGNDIITELAWVTINGICKLVFWKGEGKISFVSRTTLEHKIKAFNAGQSLSCALETLTLPLHHSAPVNSNHKSIMHADWYSWMTSHYIKVKFTPCKRLHMVQFCHIKVDGITQSLK